MKLPFKKTIIASIIASISWMPTQFSYAEVTTLNFSPDGFTNVYDISADGSVLVGSYATPSGDGHAYRWTQETGMIDLGTLGGSSSQAETVSADGSVIAGTSNIADGNSHAYRWTQSTGMIDLGTLGGTGSYVEAMSDDGAVIVGDSYNADNDQRAFRWTQETGMVSLGTLGGTYSGVVGVSADGSAVAGSSATADGNSHAFHWTQSTGMVDLGTLGGTDSSAKAISGNGEVVVGGSYIASGDTHAFRWTQSTGIVDLGTLGGVFSIAKHVSNDGTKVFGNSYTLTNDVHGFRWTDANGMIDLGTLGGTYSSVYGISANGNVAVGYSTLLNEEGRGFRWTEQTGMQSVEDWLRSEGVTVSPTITTDYAELTNADGSIVIGKLTTGDIYIARVVAPTPTPTPTPEPTPTPTPEPTPTPTPEPVGSGLIIVSEFNETIASSAYTFNKAANYLSSTVIHGAHGSPMQALLKKGQNSMWTSGDFGKQENKTDFNIGELGFAHGLNDNTNIKLSVGREYSKSDTMHNGFVKINSAYIVPEIVTVIPNTNFHVSVTGYYSQGKADIHRGYLNAGLPTVSEGKTDVKTTGLRLRVDWLNGINIGSDTSITPYASWTSMRSKADGYRETTGGFPVQWNSRVENTNQIRLGADLTHTVNEGFKLIARAEAVRQLEKKGSSISGRVIGLYDFNLPEENYKQNWQRVGFGLEKKIGPGIASVMVNATNEGDNVSSFGFINYRVNF